jgi:hypothetical protein
VCMTLAPTGMPLSNPVDSHTAMLTKVLLGCQGPSDEESGGAVAPEGVILATREQKL